MPTISSERRRSKFDFGEKQPRAGLYGPSEYPLFVPTELLLAVHQYAAEGRFWRRSPPLTMQGISDALRARMIAVAKETLQGWKTEYKEHAWFDPWMRGREAAPHVTVATLGQIQSCKKAWDYAAHCRQAGIRDKTYRAWFILKQIPDLRWLHWLYGEQPSPRCFVIDLNIQRLRAERRRTNVAVAAGVSKKTLIRWCKDHGLWKVIEAVCEIVSANSGYERLKTLPRWKSLPNEEKDLILKFARSWTMNACCKRAGFTSVTTYYGRLRLFHRWTPTGYVRCSAKARGAEPDPGIV